MASSSSMRAGPVLALAACALFVAAAEAADPPPGRSVPSMGNDHIASPGAPHPPYNSDPPTSGPHVRWVAKWGAHTAPIPLEVQVHNLEDGGVVIQYNCSSAPCPELIAKLEALLRHPDLLAMPQAMIEHGAEKFLRLIVAPYPTMKAKIALTAWGRIETLEHYDQARILQFIKAYIGIDHHPASE
ncbi:MAG: DUF3105 domain-containing protein [Nitrospirota bacterium]